MGDLLAALSSQAFHIIAPSPARVLLIWTLALFGALAALGIAALIFVGARSLSRGLRAMLAILLVLLAGGLAALRSWVVAEEGPGRFAVIEAMAARPRDPWPRSSGHIPLGPLGSPPELRGYMEPGGGFSPWFGSYGVSFWIVGRHGERLATSDDIPLQDVRQRYLYEAEPGVQVSTPDYDATWRVLADRASLTLSAHARAGAHIEIVLRGVGPAGGPLRDVAVASAKTLRLNDKWSVEFDQPIAVTYLGPETAWGDPPVRPAATAHRADGWTAVRLKVPDSRATRVDFLRPGPAAAGAPSAPGSPIATPDPRFDASLRAQIATLEQAVVGADLTPGDPANYPLGWLRDGAYELVALARGGRTALVRRVAPTFAEHDFFGGFGAEADGPGLALWALDEASVALVDPSFDRSLWPHVARKAGQIETMLQTRKDVEAGFSGPVVPRERRRKDLNRVAGPARDGLIVGRMDWHEPIYFVNAVSYDGLRSASRLARRAGHPAEAARWDAEADALRAAWRAAFARDTGGEKQNVRTATVGLWPLRIAGDAPYADLLSQRWDALRTPDGAFKERPSWTYFDVAETLQWLRLGRSDRVWPTLEWFWANSPAPGLYTLWEGVGEENSFDRWKTVRGWTTPPNVTPHYWSAANMLLLQLAMLADAEQTPSGAQFAVGRGVPAAWLRKPMDVAPIGTSEGPVSWRWDGRSVTVVTRIPGDIVLGSSFPWGTHVIHRIEP